MPHRTRRMLKSKIHRATVTDANLAYEGSITIDTDLMALADIRPFEQVFVVSINTGVRFETYAMEGPAGRGDLCLNGAAARLAERGDLVIVMTYAEYADAELEGHDPVVVHVDEHNRPITATGSPIPATVPAGWEGVQ